MEELIEETFPIVTEETTVITTVEDLIEETTVVTTVPDEEFSVEDTSVETDVVPDFSTFEFEHNSEQINLLFESNDMCYLYERVYLDNKTIIENQTTIITQLQEQNTHLAEMNTLLANFFFCFMVLMVCKFVHFLFYKVFFGGLT